METRVMELLFGRNKDEITRGNRKGKKNTTFGRKRI